MIRKELNPFVRTSKKSLECRKVKKKFKVFETHIHTPFGLSVLIMLLTSAAPILYGLE